MRKLTRPECPDPTELQRNYKFPANKSALERASFGKCMYCESKVSHVYFGDVEHIRPKDAGKFPELEFVWENLGFCCSRCNNAKRNQFDEDCPLIDPYSEEPSGHLIAYGPLLLHKAGSERGALTIQTIALNRAELVERRSMHMTEIQAAIDACYRTKNAGLRAALLDSLAKEAGLDKEYSMFATTLIDMNQA